MDEVCRVPNARRPDALVMQLPSLTASKEWMMQYTRLTFVSLTMVLGLTLLLSSAEIARAQNAPVNAIEIGHWDGYSGTYSDVWADGDYAYMPNWGLADGQPAQIHIVDISDPTNPVLDNVLSLSSPNSFASPQDVKVANGLLFVALEGDGNDSVAIVDVRDPTAPVELATIRIDGFENPHTLFYDQGFLYIVDSADPEMAIVDLTDFDPDNPPASPMTEAKWTIEMIGSAFVHDVTVQNGRAYVCAWDTGLWIYDITDVANNAPVFLGRGLGIATHAVWPTDDGQFVVVGEERDGGPIKLYEIVPDGEFVAVNLVDTVDLSADAFSSHNPIVIGDRVYVSWYQAGLQVFDIDRDAGELVFVASYDTSESGNNGGFNGNWGVYPFLGTDKILLSDMQNGLSIVAVVPEDCTPGDDCNGNGVLDQCDVTVGTSQDCNGTLVPDECEIESGTSMDCQGNGVPDECEGDCNENGIADECDINTGTSDDCQGNLIPDECETDCNGNAVPDECDLSAGTSIDCQPNGIPDECDLADGPLEDFLLAQPPDLASGIPADADPGEFGVLSPAENFLIDFPKSVHSVKLWGIYFPDNSPSDDDFTVIIHHDDAGLPGDVIYSENAVATDRVATGETLFGIWDEFEFTLTLAEPVSLEPGTYFVEIFNNTVGNSDSFIWEGGLDAQIPGIALAGEAPGVNWSTDGGLDLSIEVQAGVIGADENEDGVPDECGGCEGDANGDGTVDPLDAGFVLARFGCPVGTGDPSCDAADQNGDGSVDPLDSGFVLARFGPCE